jgi:hypothetical protein
MYMKRPYLIIGLSLLVLSGCKQDEEQVEPGIVIYRKSRRVQVSTQERLQTLRFFRDSSGKITMPVLIRSQPRFFLTGVKSVPRPEAPLHAVAAEQNYFYLPETTNAESFLLLIRTLPSLPEWRVFEIDSTAIPADTNTVLTLPQFNTLPLLKGKAFEKEVLRLYPRGKKCYSELSENEK